MKLSKALLLNVLLGVLFIIFSGEVITKQFIFLDNLISLYIYSYRSHPLTQIMEFFTFIGDLPMNIFLTAGITLILANKIGRKILFFTSSMIGIGFLNLFLKDLFRLPRPEDLSSLAVETSFGYPSGHAMGNLVLYSFLIFYVSHFAKNKKIKFLVGAAAIGFIVLIGFSRIYLGVHYPSDVLGGYLAALWFLSFSFLIYKKIN